MRFRLAFRPRLLAAAVCASVPAALQALVGRSRAETVDGVPPVASLAQAQPHNPLFDASFYRDRYKLDLSDADLYLHYCHSGRFQNYDPNEHFSTSWYLDKNNDVRKSKINPLDHYIELGAVEGRDPGPAFSSWAYWLLNPDVKAAGMNPLLHYLRHGRSEGRLAPTPQVLIDARASAGRSPEVIAEPALEASDVPSGAPPPRPRKIAGAAWARSCADDPAAERVIARRCPIRVVWYAKLFARDLAASFHGVRLLGSFPEPVAGPLVLFTNHASWWDAELYHWLATTGFARRRGFAPMEATNLARYPSLTRLGAFPTYPGGGYKGAAAFLNTAERLLREPDAVLFIAAEGRFRDQRERPIRVMPGISHLARRVPTATFVPLAIDYVFWRDRRPNLLLHFGRPIGGASLAGASTPEIVSRFSGGLETAMSCLAEAGMSRQPLRFTTLLGEGRNSRPSFAIRRGATVSVQEATFPRGLPSAS